MVFWKDYEVREAVKEDIPIITSMVEQYFFPEELIFECLFAKYKSTLTEADIRQIHEDLRITNEAMILNHLCLVAIYRVTGKIVGANIMYGTFNPKLVPPKDRLIDVYKTYPPKSQFVRDYFYYINSVIDRADLFTKFPNAKFFVECSAMTIDKGHRNNGLTVFLTGEGIKLCWKRGADVAMAVCTSPYSKKAAEKMGMRCVIDYDLLEHKDADGSPIFEAARGQNIIYLLAKARDKDVKCSKLLCSL